MAADALFAKDAQDSIREAVQDPRVQQMLNSLLQQRRQLFDYVKQSSGGTALFLMAGISVHDPLVPEVVQRASQQGVTLNPADVQNWLDQNGAPAA